MTASFAASPDPSLCTSEGVLVSVSIPVDPRSLETLLEALAQLDFPINPQIYHEAEMVYRYADGRETREPVTLVEFPAVAQRLEAVTRTLQIYGLDPAGIQTTGILLDLEAASVREPAPWGAAYESRSRHRLRKFAD